MGERIFMGLSPTDRQLRDFLSPKFIPSTSVARQFPFVKTPKKGGLTRFSETDKTTCVTKTTTHISKKLRKWPNRDRTTPSSMALFGHYLAKNHPTKNAIEQKYSPRARASSGHAPWRCPTDFPFHGFPPALLTIFYMNRQQGSRSG